MALRTSDSVRPDVKSVVHPIAERQCSTTALRSSLSHKKFSAPATYSRAPWIAGGSVAVTRIELR